MGTPRGWRTWLIFKSQPAAWFAPADSIHIEGLRVARFGSEQRGTKGVQVWDVAVAVHDENIKASREAPFKFGRVAPGWHNHNGEVRRDVAPPFKADCDMPHAAAHRNHAITPRIVDRLGVGRQLLDCHGLPPLNTRRSSPTCQAVTRSDNFRGAGSVPALTRRHTVAAEQANSACTTGWRTMQDSGRESKLRSAAGMSAAARCGLCFICATPCELERTE